MDQKAASCSLILSRWPSGFDSPLRAGFNVSKAAYVDWIIAEIEKIGVPVDLVGHDWGGMLTARVASLRPDLVRTWAGGSCPVDAEYDWHEIAKIWQAPGDGERWMDAFNPNEFAEALVGFAVPPEDARNTVRFIDPVMKDCLLKLYRSAVHVGAEWSPGLAEVTSPTLIFWGIGDHFLPHALADRLGEATHADAVVKLRCEHWTVLQRPSDVAHELEAHWNRHLS